MKIEETTAPVERTFTVELTLDELKVFAGATGVANFNEVSRTLQARRMNVENVNDILYRMHCDFGDFVSNKNLGTW